MPSAAHRLRHARSERRSRAPTSGRTPTLGDPALLGSGEVEGVAVCSPTTPDSKVESMTYSVAVSGASGYAGGEILRLLAAHPDIEIRTVTAHSNAGQPLVQHQPHLRSLAHLTLQDTTPEMLAGPRHRLPRSAARPVGAVHRRARRHAARDRRGRRPPAHVERRLGARSTAATSTNRGPTVCPSCLVGGGKQRDAPGRSDPHRRPRLQRQHREPRASPPASPPA